MLYDIEWTIKGGAGTVTAPNTGLPLEASSLADALKIIQSNIPGRDVQHRGMVEFVGVSVVPHKEK